MRGMNMLQLVGGVAVAGVVAAGTTAFTAAGFTRATGITSDTVVGGTLSQNIIGAQLNGVAFTYDATDPTLVTSVKVTVTGSGGATLPTASRVSIVSAGTKSAGTAPEFYCGVTATVSSQEVATCPFLDNVGGAAATITAMTSLKITVNGPTV